jgi:hypothetical protein
MKIEDPDVVVELLDSSWAMSEEFELFRFYGKDLFRKDFNLYPNP